MKQKSLSWNIVLKKPKKKSFVVKMRLNKLRKKQKKKQKLLVFWKLDLKQ